MKTKTKTERDFLQFKISINRESSDFLHIETVNQNGKWIFPIQVFNKRRKFWLFTYWNGKPKQKENYCNSSFKQTEKVQNFNKLNVKIESENQNRKIVFQIQDQN